MKAWKGEQGQQKKPITSLSRALAWGADTRLLACPFGEAGPQRGAPRELFGAKLDSVWLYLWESATRCQVVAWECRWPAGWVVRKASLLWRRGEGGHAEVPREHLCPSLYRTQ